MPPSGPEAGAGQIGDAVRADDDRRIDIGGEQCRGMIRERAALPVGGGLVRAEPR